jgi:hypothetical protein
MFIPAFEWFNDGIAKLGSGKDITLVDYIQSTPSASDYIAR